LKVDVEKGLPPKKELIVYCPLSATQNHTYGAVLKDNIEVLHTGGGGERLKLLNVVMQLRKACNHPYLFEGVEDRGLNPMGEHLIQNCGKLQLLDKLLTRLQEEGSRVLIFSQMTRILDILEDYCTIRGFEMCRIDGSTSGDDRDDGEFNQIYLFFSASLLF
jgi:SWI/SNF-related matrix-associated actin-dependent regulator of chromatin subfamily A member 5